MSDKYSFIETLDKSAFQLDEKPQFGFPQFPLKEFEKAILQRFNLKDLEITYEEKGWLKTRPEGEILALMASTITTPFFWVMTSKDQKALLQELFNSDEEATYFLENPLMKGLYQLMALNVLSEIDHLKFVNDVTFNLAAEPKNLEEGNFYRVDVSLKLSKNKVSGSLYFPTTFRKEWKNHFSKDYQFFLSDELKKKLPLEISIEIGYSQIELEELKKAKKGDFLILDRSTYDLDKKEGSALLTLNGEALFRAKLRQEGIKILEFPKVEEANKGMSMEENMEEMESEAFLNELPQKKAETSLEKLPLQVVVEVGRLKMTVEELANLSPGSLLDLKLSADEGIDLVVSNRKIGKGDLVKIGDTIGVRITKI